MPRGNHKSSQSVLNAAALNKAISKEIDHVWALPLIIEYLQSIKNAGFVPLGVAEQFSINEKGERYVKRRITHDCSFPGLSGLSVNNQVQWESPQPCFYGFCLLSILHMIFAMRSRWLTKTILIGKNRPGRSLPPDTCTREPRIDMHCNSLRASLSMFEVTLWHHTCTSGVYDYQWSGNRPRRRSTFGRALPYLSPDQGS